MQVQRGLDDRRTEPCWLGLACLSLGAAYMSMSLMGMLLPRNSPVPAVIYNMTFLVEPHHTQQHGQTV